MYEQDEFEKKASKIFLLAWFPCAWHQGLVAVTVVTVISGNCLFQLPGTWSK